LIHESHSNISLYHPRTIRFQNTGNAPAINVNIEDTLDSRLDWNTFKMISSSHHCTVLTKEGRNRLWRFNAINLPDSVFDERGSHGFITFSIKPKLTVGIGEVISNKADIYFDYNLPVTTNTEHTSCRNSSTEATFIRCKKRRYYKRASLEYCCRSKCAQV
jgi:hypothetical protein